MAENINTNQEFDFVMPTNKIYARPNDEGVVTKLFSSVFYTPEDGDILIEEGNEDYHAHVHLKYSLFTEDEPRVYQYKIVNNRMLKRTNEEMAADRESFLPPLINVQNERQEENKKALAEFLENHPLEWEGKLYGVTEQDQLEINMNLAQYQLAVSAGVPAKLEWHSKHQACVEFSIQDFTQLALAITNYVYPYLRYQESVKTAIYGATTRQEVADVVIDYDSVTV